MHIFANFQDLLCHFLRGQQSSEGPFHAKLTGSDTRILPCENLKSHDREVRIETNGKIHMLLVQVKMKAFHRTSRASFHLKKAKKGAWGQPQASCKPCEPTAGSPRELHRRENPRTTVLGLLGQEFRHVDNAVPATSGVLDGRKGFAVFLGQLPRRLVAPEIALVIQYVIRAPSIVSENVPLLVAGDDASRRIGICLETVVARPNAIRIGQRHSIPELRPLYHVPAEI